MAVYAVLIASVACCGTAPRGCPPCLTTACLAHASIGCRRNTIHTVRYAWLTSLKYLPRRGTYAQRRARRQRTHRSLSRLRLRLRRLLLSLRSLSDARLRSASALSLRSLSRSLLRSLSRSRGRSLEDGLGPPLSPLPPLPAAAAAAAPPPPGGCLGPPGPPAPPPPGPLNCRQARHVCGHGRYNQRLV
jgi:hypothetical protein